MHPTPSMGEQSSSEELVTPRSSQELQAEVDSTCEDQQKESDEEGDEEGDGEGGEEGGEEIVKEGDKEPPADKVLDMKAFLETVNGGRVFTRELLHNAARQLQNAKEGKDVELLDCFEK